MGIKRNCLQLHIGTLYLICSVSALTASSLQRNLEPVIVSGNTLQEFSGVNIDSQEGELFLFSFLESSQSWQAIPFQFDEIDTSGSYFPPNGDDIPGLDDNDELVFFAADAGQRALGSWIPDIDSENYSRYEITVLDPLSSQVAYVYLYRSTSLTPDPELTDYVEHLQNNTGNVGADTVKSVYYELRHGVNGLPQDLKIPVSAGGNGIDLFDRLKMRATITVFGGNQNIDEDDLKFKQGDAVFVKDGPIRVIRQVDATLVVSVGFFSLDVDLPLPPAFYYPYSSHLDVQIPSLSSVEVTQGRLSVDLNAAALGMKFVSGNNPEPGLLIDGLADPYEKNINNLLPDNNWTFITGGQGTLVYLFPLGSSVGGARELYYQDNSSVNNNDTGDKKSYADTGPLLTNGIGTPFTLRYRGYYLSQNQSSDLGSKIAGYSSSPLQLSTEIQGFGTVPVELAVFKGHAAGNSAYLQWTTLSESNNFGFNIERLAGGQHIWKKVGFAPGHGTTTAARNYSFVDQALAVNSYEYRLKQLDTDGAFEYSQVLTISIEEPETFALHQNYPNPFNPTTIIQYETRGNGLEEYPRTELFIYNLSGSLVRSLVEQDEQPGYHSVTWDGKGNRGEPLPSGIYVYRLRSSGFVKTKKMLLVR